MTTVSAAGTEHQADDRFAAGLRAAGLKLTAQRGAICRALADMAGRHHPTVQEIFESSRQHHTGVSLATVYNTLAVLKDQGMLYELGPDLDGAVHYELDTDTHVNVVCVRCKKIIDLHHLASASLEEAVVEQTGFSLVGGQVLYYGFCPDCRKASNTSVAD
ncbi:MAG: Fur family transcriptional regulator [Bacillota bacterium]